MVCRTENMEQRASSWTTDGLDLHGRRNARDMEAHAKSMSHPYCTLAGIAWSGAAGTATFLAGTVAMDISPAEHAANISTLVVVATAVGMVIAGLSWLDRRIDRKIRDHAEAEQRLDDERQQRTIAEMRTMLSEYAASKHRR